MVTRRLTVENKGSPEWPVASHHPRQHPRGSWPCCASGAGAVRQELSPSRFSIRDAMPYKLRGLWGKGGGSLLLRNSEEQEGSCKGLAGASRVSRSQSSSEVLWPSVVNRL